MARGPLRSSHGPAAVTCCQLARYAPLGEGSAKELQARRCKAVDEEEVALIDDVALMRVMLHLPVRVHQRRAKRWSVGIDADSLIRAASSKGKYLE